MPHKHKRRGNDSTIYDLPPSMIAKSLPVRDPNSKSKKNAKDGKKNPPNAKKDALEKYQARRKGAAEDDTPKAFLRLMQRQPRGKQAAGGGGGADAGESKKRKRDGADKQSDGAASRKKKTAAKPAAAETKADPDPEPAADAKTRPKILPGEKLSDFAARVDRELPLSAMNKSNKPAPADLPKIREHRLTKHEKHLRRLQEQWRKDDAEIREREEAQREEREEEMEEQLELWKQWEAEGGARKAKKKGSAARKNGGGDAKGDSDPWAKLNRKDRSNKPANLFDVAEAPPQLTKPTEKFKVRGGAKVDVANVPVAAGSLRRREELAGERRNIVEEYRRLMAAKRQ